MFIKLLKKLLKSYLRNCCKYIVNNSVYAGIVKRHNVCKRHVFIDTGFRQTERAIFLHVISMG